MVMESYFVIHDMPKDRKRGKRKRVNPYDPNADKSDIRYMENYGL